MHTSYAKIEETRLLAEHPKQNVGRVVHLTRLWVNLSMLFDANQVNGDIWAADSEELENKVKRLRDRLRNPMELLTDLPLCTLYVSV